MKLRSIRISENNVLSDMLIKNGHNELIAFSVMGYKTKINNILRLLKKKQNVYVYPFGNINFSNEFNTYKTEDGNGNVHLVALAKDNVEYDSSTGAEKIDIFILTREQISRAEPIGEDLKEKFFNKISRHTPIPMCKEWSEYLIKQLAFEHSNTEHSLSCVEQDDRLRAYQFKFSVNRMYAIIEEGFKTGQISYDSLGISERLQASNGLDEYLQSYGPKEFKTEIESKFAPLFDPDKHEYSERTQDVFDYIQYHGINLYPAQRNIIEASARNLRKGNSLKIAEQGTGKTVMGMATVYAAMKSNKPTANMVICPGHLVEKWAAEINERFPLGKAIIVDNFSHFMSTIKPMIDDPARKHHLFLIISKNTAKNHYVERPAANYSKQHKCYTCPDCGQPLKKRKKIGKGKSSRYDRVLLQEADWFSKNEDNARCKEHIRVFNKTTGSYEEKICGAHLWTAYSRNKQTKWLQMPEGAGWVYAPQLAFLELTLDAQVEDSKRSIAKYERAIERLRTSVENGEHVVYAPRSYSIAKYLLKHEGLDYLIADELHDYKSNDSDQGIAFGRLCSASKRVLGMTGTLVNGYASSVFFILFRMFPHAMRKHGYHYNDVEQFVKHYGVIKKETTTKLDGSSKSIKPKEIPGVSPHVFTKFLLNHAAFLRMDDVSEGLPSYQEIPVACNMTAEVESAYKDIERAFSDLFGGRPEKGKSTMMSNFNPLMSVFPDQTFDQPDIINPETNEVYYETPIIPRTITNDKEERTIEIAKQAIENGEKVLIYTTFTNRADANTRLIELFKEEGIKACLLKSSTVESRKRAAWIDKKLDEGMQVMICNPTLVETGLDLLPFTSIIFYQIPYNLFTLRQASRRSLRLNQTQPVKVYFMYFEETMQARAVGLMASKQKASQAIEGNFTEEGLNALSETQDMLSAIASNIVAGIEATIDESDFINTETSNEACEVRQVSTRAASVSSLPEYSLLSAIASLPKKRKRPNKLMASTHEAMHNLFDNGLSVANLY